MRLVDCSGVRGEETRREEAKLNNSNMEQSGPNKNGVLVVRRCCHYWRMLRRSFLISLSH